MTDPYKQSRYFDLDENEAENWCLLSPKEKVVYRACGRPDLASSSAEEDESVIQKIKDRIYTEKGMYEDKKLKKKKVLKKKTEKMAVEGVDANLGLSQEPDKVVLASDIQWIPPAVAHIPSSVKNSRLSTAEKRKQSGASVEKTGNTLETDVASVEGHRKGRKKTIKPDSHPPGIKIATSPYTETTDEEIHKYRKPADDYAPAKIELFKQTSTTSEKMELFIQTSTTSMESKLSLKGYTEKELRGSIEESADFQAKDIYGEVSEYHADDEDDGATATKLAEDLTNATSVGNLGEDNEAQEGRKKRKRKKTRGSMQPEEAIVPEAEEAAVEEKDDFQSRKKKPSRKPDVDDEAGGKEKKHKQKHQKGQKNSEITTDDVVNGMPQGEDDYDAEKEEINSDHDKPEENEEELHGAPTKKKKKKAAKHGKVEVEEQAEVEQPVEDLDDDERVDQDIKEEQLQTSEATEKKKKKVKAPKESKDEENVDTIVDNENDESDISQKKKKKKKDKHQKEDINEDNDGRNDDSVANDERVNEKDETEGSLKHKKKKKKRQTSEDLNDETSEVDRTEPKTEELNEETSEVDMAEPKTPKKRSIENVNVNDDHSKEDDGDNDQDNQSKTTNKKGKRQPVKTQIEADSGRDADDEYEDTDASYDVIEGKKKNKLAAKQPQLEDVEASDVDVDDRSSIDAGGKKKAPAKKAPVKPKPKPAPKEAAPKEAASKEATPKKGPSNKESAHTPPDEEVEGDKWVGPHTPPDEEVEGDKWLRPHTPPEEEVEGDKRGMIETDVGDKSTTVTRKEEENEEDQYYLNLDAEGQALYNELADQAKTTAQEEEGEDDFNLYFSSEEESVVEEEVKVVERKKIIKQKLVILPGRYYKYKRNNKGALEEGGVAGKWRPGAPVPQLDSIKINAQVLAHMNQQDKRMREREMPSLDFRPGVTPAKAPTEHVKDYFAKHKIFELCNFLMGAVLKQTPDCPLDFMINIVHEINGQRGLIKGHGGTSSVTGECHLTPRDNDIANLHTLHTVPSVDRNKEVTQVGLSSISENQKPKGKKGKGKITKKGSTREPSLTRVDI